VWIHQHKSLPHTFSSREYASQTPQLKITYGTLETDEWKNATAEAFQFFLPSKAVGHPTNLRQFPKFTDINDEYIVALKTVEI